MREVLKYTDFINERESTKKEKVLFISFRKSEKNSLDRVDYHKYLRTKLNCTFCEWEDLIFDENKILLGNKNVKEFDFIFIGVVGKNENYFVTLEKYCKENKVPYFKYGCSSERNNKIYQNTNMSINQIPQIPTVISKCSSVDSKDLIKELGLPIITKIVNGSQGKGVEMQKTGIDLEKYLKKNKDETIIFQKFVENDGDYRIFIIGQDVMYSIKRKTKDEKKEFRNNYSLGGTADRVEIPKKAMDIAKKASKSMGFDVSGVDLIKEKGLDNWYVLEVNSAPQFDWEEEGRKPIADYREVLDKFIEIIKRKIN